MAENSLHVEIVAADRLVWSGDSTCLNARTAGGEIGILANHMPVLSLLAPGAVEVDTPDGETFTVAVDEGILSVANNRVSVLASHAELADDIDLSTARAELEEARADTHRSQAEVHRLEARARAARSRS
jgi:F-type H+-transporting ATPase subunit epsilon